MTLKLDPNPFHWSADLKAVTQLATLVITLGGPLVYIGRGLYNFAEIQTELIQQVKAMQGELIDQKNEIATTNTQREKSFEGLKSDVVPRITKLEDAIHTAETEAAAAHARADDMKEDLLQLKEYASKNLAVSEAHSADIKATRDAVAPKMLP